MQRPGGNRRSGNDDGSGNRRGGFPDPFGEFGGFGFGGGGGGGGGFGFGGSMMQDFFGRDPFDDPFFNRPFGSLFGNGGFPFGSRQQGGQGGFLEQRPSSTQQEGRRGPIIEEIDEDHPDTSSRPKSSQEPIVEHPDDDVRPDRNRQSRGLRRQQGPVLNQGDGAFQSFSFQSSSFSAGGPNGQYYTSSTSRRSGPNGVCHEEHFEKDSTSRTETHRISKGVQDKGHSHTRKRNAEGREENIETLHNLGEDEVPEFEKRWETEADRNLPGWNRSRARTLTGNNGALPSGGSSGWSGARQA